MAVTVEADSPTAPLEAPSPRARERWRALGGRDVLPHVPVAVLMLVYALYFSRLTVEIYRGYGSPGYDMGIFDQGIWLLSRFHNPFVTVMGRNLFGDHTSFILFLLVPLYWIYPHPAALLVFQSFALALGALPIYLLARRLLNDTVFATILAGAFLLHPALQWGNLEQFHPECFLVPLVGFAIYAAVVWKPWWLLVLCALCLLVKEDVFLLIVPLGIWVALRRDRKVGATLVAGAGLYALFATEVVIRSLLGTPTLYAGRVPFGGPSGFFNALVRKPGLLFDYLRQDRRPFYAWQMAFPSALAFLRAPGVAAIGLLTLGADIVSNFPYQHQILYHYSLPLVPILAAGAVYGVSKLKNDRHQAVAVWAVAVCSLWACFLWGAFPAFSTNKVPHWKPQMQQVHDIESVQALLPPHAVISVYYSYVSHLDHRQRVYQWPTPFKAAYWDRFKQEGQRLPFAGDVQYVFVPVHLSQQDQVVLDTIQQNFRLVRTVGDVQLLKRAP